jgi:HK97 family phage portal protein
MFASSSWRAGDESRGPTDDFWYTELGTPGVAGARVNATTAMRLSTVYKCVRAIAETSALLPLPVYRRLERGKERAPRHWLAQLLAQPNPWQTGMQWREMMTGHAALRGNGYSEIVWNRAGYPERLVPLHPDRTKPEVLDSGMPRYRTTDAQGRERVLVFGEVLHLQGFAVDGYEGLNPIAAQREAIGAGIVTRDYGARYFGNSARPPTWVEFPGKFKDDAARRQWVQDFKAANSGHNTGTSPVFEQGMKLHALALSNTDAQWLEAVNASANDIAGIFRVPPHKIGILSEAKWANIEHQQIDWVTDGVMPWCVRWEQMLWRDLLLGDEEYFAEHVLDMLLRGDTKSRFEAYGKGIQDGWLTRNEAREKENMNPLGGLDKPLEPLNMAPAGSRGASQQRGQDPDARALAIQTAAAERLVRKELQAMARALRDADAPSAVSEFYRAHVDLVAAAMAVSREAADRYCLEAANWVRSHVAQGAATGITHEAFTTRQVAALLRLED